MNPVGDLRDITAGAIHVAENKKGSTIQLTAATVGAIPLIGDVAKPIIKAEQKVIVETIENSLENSAKATAKGAERETVKNGVESSTKAATKTGVEALESIPKNWSDVEKWIGRDIKAGDALPEGYHWRQNGQIYRNPHNAESGYAALSVDVNGKVALREIEGRLSISSVMNRNYKEAVTAEVRAEIKAANAAMTEAQISAEVAKRLENKQIHHIIPDELVQKTELGQAAQKAGYNLDKGENLIGLPNKDAWKEGDVGHWSNHPEYTKQVKIDMEKRLIN